MKTTFTTSEDKIEILLSRNTGAIKSTDKNSTVQLSLPIAVKSKKTDVSQSEAGIYNMSDLTPITTFPSLPGEGLPGQDDHQT